MKKHITSLLLTLAIGSFAAPALARRAAPGSETSTVAPRAGIQLPQAGGHEDHNDREDREDGEQHGRGMHQDRGHREEVRNARRNVRDDIRDTRGMHRLARQFAQATRDNNRVLMQGTMQSFVQAGRADVAELRAEAQAQPQTQPQRAMHRARRLERATALLQQLEAAASTPQTPATAQQTQQMMHQFTRISRREVFAARRAQAQARAGAQRQ